MTNACRIGRVNWSAFLKPKLLILYVVILVYSFVNRMITTPLTTFGLALGISGFGLGTLQNFCEIACMLGRPLAGAMVDNGHKKLAQASAFALMAIVSLGFSVTSNRVMYGVVRLFQGFATAYASSVMASLLPTEVPVVLLGTATAISSAINSLGAAWAPMLSKKLFTQHSYTSAYWVPCVAALVVTVFSLLWQSRTENAEPPEKAMKKMPLSFREILSAISPTALPACAIGLFANIAKDANDFYTVQLGIDRGIDVTAGIAIAGTLAIFVGIFAGLLIDKLKPQGVLIPAFIALAASNFLYAFANSTAMATAAALLFRVGLGAYWPALIVQCCYILPGRRATAIATVYFFLDCVSMINNLLLGYLYDTVGVAKMFFIVGCINIFAVVYYLLLRKFYLKKKESAVSGS